MHREQIDGIVLVSAFPCGPDSMTDEIVSRHFAPLPVLRLVLDTQTGTAGIETPLESFADILSFQKKGGFGPMNQKKVAFPRFGNYNLCIKYFVEQALNAEYILQPPLTSAMLGGRRPLQPRLRLRSF